MSYGLCARCERDLKNHPTDREYYEAANLTEERIRDAFRDIGLDPKKYGLGVNPAKNARDYSVKSNPISETTKLQMQIARLEKEKAEWQVRFAQSKTEYEHRIEELEAQLIMSRNARGVLNDIFGNARAGVSIAKDKLKILVKLCHPDKHKNSEEATEITKWLLEMYKK